MKKYYQSDFYEKPIEVENVEGDITVSIYDKLDRGAVYSWYNMVDKSSHSDYINKCILGGLLQENIKNILVLGVGGGAFIKYIEDHIPNINITGVDIDKTMIEIAKKELCIQTDDLIVGDIIKVIGDLQRRNITYDMILFDVYGSTGEIPQSITDLTLFKKIQSILTKTGIFSINYANFFIHSNETLDIIRKEAYGNIHHNLKNIFGNHFLAFLDKEPEGGNISGIYNLKKKIIRDDIKREYFQKVKNNGFIYDEKIIEGIYLDEKKLFLQ
ncbi:MAG: methyltransferase domain-containing protein [Candidatus Gracilibacteria bacterium]|nr:methyltransferase domain-containing protein [Candidatus Gracilibacteria bacterium]